MRFPLSRGILIEALILQVLAYRLLHFALVTLDNSIHLLKQQLGNTIEEKEAACKRFSQLLKSLESGGPDEKVEKTREELVGHIHECSVDIADLRSFILQANVFSLPWLGGKSTNKLVSKIVSEILRSATSPANSHRCNSIICVDWVSLTDLSPWQSVVLSYLPLSPEVHSGLIMLASMSMVISILAGSYFVRTGLRCCINFVHPRKVSAFFIVLDLILSEPARVVRVVVLAVFYLSAFTICVDEPSSILLLRMVNMLTSIDFTRLLILLVTYWTAAALLVTRLSWVHERLTTGKRSTQLEQIDREVARAWIESGIESMRRLIPTTLMRLLTLVDIKALPTQLRRDIIALILTDPFLVAVYAQRGAFPNTDHSSYACFTRQVAVTMKDLGYQEFPGVSSVLLVGVVIAAQLLIW